MSFLQASIKLLSVLLGAWIAGVVLVAIIATTNFRIAERVTRRPSAQARPVLERVPEDLRRPLLRHVVSEVNRFLFRFWGIVQVALALYVLILLARQPALDATSLVLSGVLLLLAILLAAALTPPIVSIGREMEFGARQAAQASLFGKLHAAYSLLQLIMLALLLVLTWRVK